MKTLGLYIHIPFCERKCNYCDFYSVCISKERADEYISALCQHIKSEAHLYKDYVFDTVFIGGGTPSILTSAQLELLMQTVKKELSISESAEITIEANPNSITKEGLKTYLSNGINRLSIGLQSTDNEALATLGRLHTLEDFSESYRNAREAGFKNISIDVMYGLPGQSVEGFNKTLDSVCEFEPEHISLYCLKIEENTPFGKRKNELSLPTDDEEYEMYMSMCKKLNEHGYVQYEISNFSKEGYFSRHNKKYWLCQEYVGLGPSAHSYFNGVRYSYSNDLDKYIKEAVACVPERINEVAEEQSFTEKMDEYVMLRLRLKDGVCVNEFKNHFGVDFEKEYPSMQKFVKSGHVVKENTVYRFSESGFFVSNFILTEILHF